MTIDTSCLPNAGHKSVLTILLEEITGVIRSARKRRQQRNALKSLLQMPAHRLYDLGISPEDVLQAMNRAEASGAYLQAAGRAAPLSTSAPQAPGPSESPHCSSSKACGMDAQIGSPARRFTPTGPEWSFHPAPAADAVASGASAGLSVCKPASESRNSASIQLRKALTLDLRDASGVETSQ